MTTPLQALRSLIVSSSEVTVLVGARVYSLPAPQDATVPFVTIFEVSDTPEQLLYGAATLSNARFQVDCYAAQTALSTALDIADAVRVVCDGVVGTHAGVNIRVRYLGKRHLYDDVTKYQRLSMDFRIWYDL